MKCISLWQPWATLIAIGAKRIETRGWPTRHRGPLAIHAAKKFPDEAWQWCITDTPFHAALRQAGLAASQLPEGAIVAVCTLKDCLPISELLGTIPREPERSFGDYRDGRFAWLLADVRMLDPVPYRGRQGLFDVPDDIVVAPAAGSEAGR